MLNKEELLYIRELMFNVKTDTKSELLIKHINYILDTIKFNDDLNQNSIELHKKADELNKEIDEVFKDE